MISQDAHSSLFKLWDIMGPGIKNVKYLAQKFSTWEEYYTLLAKYFEIQGGVNGLKQHIINESNEMLSSENSKCDGVVIRMYNIDLEKEMTSTARMFDAQSYGIGTNRISYFAYTEPKDWKCPEPIDEFSPEPSQYYSDAECFDGECLEEAVFNVTKHIRKKYGIGLNVEMTPEERMRGNIRIDKW